MYVHEIIVYIEDITIKITPITIYMYIEDIIIKITQTLFTWDNCVY